MSAKSGKPVVRSRWFDTSTVGGLVFAESLTRQEFRDECNINLILSRYDESPPRPWQGRAPPVLRYGDFAESPDFLGAQLLVKQAEEQFMSLPAAVRERFSHSPARFLEFVNDRANLEEARKLGLLKAEVAAPTPPTDTGAK